MTYVFTPEQVSLQGLARGTWQRRGLAKRIALRLGEETVTETFLLDLAASYPGTVTIVPFNKVEEGNSGADWAWSFESADGAYSFPMMVQAKVLDDDDRDYREIARKIGKSNVRQIDRLIAEAGKLGFPAFYAFYNHLSDVSRVPSNCRSLELAGASPMPQSFGISIAPAGAVLSALGDLSFDTHRTHSMPLHCLLCSMGTGASGPFGSPGRIGRRLAGAPPSDGLSVGPSPPPTPELPPGVRRGADPLFAITHDIRGITPENRGRLIERLREQYPGVAGIVVLRDAKGHIA